MYRRGFHPTSTSGAFGAAVTAACLLNLSVEQMLNAVGIAGSFASGNMEYLAQGTLTKRVQPGQAAHAGILSALLAQQGYTGPGTILEGEFGFLHAYSDSPVVGRLTADLGGDVGARVDRRQSLWLLPLHAEPNGSGDPHGHAGRHGVRSRSRRFASAW